jgi:parallel beta-helix repeat protein
MKTTSVITAALCGLSLCTQLIFGQGSLIPPGAPAPTMKTLDQIEPRTPIGSLPYTISQPGSYYLTTSLTANPGGIGILASGVTLDLMGFELNGSGGSSAGIAVAPGLANICIRNGTVRGWRYDGVNISSANSSLQDLRVSENSGNGLVVGDGSVVRGCTASFNTGSGIVARDACSILGCVVFANQTNGISIGAAGVVRDCSAMSNRLFGVSTGRGASIQHCNAAYNNLTGIRAFAGSTVTGCSAYLNKGHGITDETDVFGAPGLSVSDCSATSNDQNGIFVTNGSAVKNCLAKGNKGNGIQACCSYGSTIPDCSVIDNQGTGVVFEARSTINGCTVSGNSFNGIDAQHDCTFAGCTVINNGVNGILVAQDGNRIDGNLVRNNSNDGIRVDAAATKNVVVRNMASGNANFQYRVPGLPGQPPAAANVVGTIVTDAANANAWANFSN